MQNICTWNANDSIRIFFSSDMARFVNQTETRFFQFIFIEQDAALNEHRPNQKQNANAGNTGRSN